MDISMNLTSQWTVIFCTDLFLSHKRENINDAFLWVWLKITHIHMLNSLNSFYKAILKHETLFVFE